MTTLEALLAGAMLTLTPSLIALAVLAWCAPEVDLD
jgi:hypothetical protein